MKKIKYMAICLSICFSALFLTSCNRTEGNQTESYLIVSDGTSVSVEEKIDSKPPATFTYDDMISLYGYYQLSDREKEIYNNIVARLSRFETQFPLECTSQQLQKIFELIRLEQLSFSHIVDRNVGGYNEQTQYYDVNVKYRYTDIQLEQMNYEVVKKADEIISVITPQMTDYDKLKYFHDYLIENCESDVNDDYGDTMYGTLIRKRAFCEGYAKTFSYLCNRVGIKNIIVTGRTSVPHMWNMVELDGKWYHIDVTWDSPDSRIAEYFPDLILYQYFLTTDDIVKNYRAIDSELFVPPVADDFSMSYFVQEGYNPKNYDAVLDILNEKLPQVKEKNQKYMMLKFNSTDMYMKNMQLLTTTDDKDMRIIDYFSNMYGIQIAATDYYAMDRIILLIFYY